MKSSSLLKMYHAGHIPLLGDVRLGGKGELEERMKIPEEIGRLWTDEARGGNLLHPKHLFLEI